MKVKTPHVTTENNNIALVKIIMEQGTGQCTAFEVIFCLFLRESDLSPVPTICLISPAFYKILLNMFDYKTFIVYLQKINNRGYNHEIFK